MKSPNLKKNSFAEIKREYEGMKKFRKPCPILTRTSHNLLAAPYEKTRIVSLC